MIMQYIVKDLDDREIGRSNDARSAWELIEAEWPDAVVISLDGTRARRWMRMAALLESTGEVTIIRRERTVGGVTVEDDAPELTSLDHGKGHGK